MFQRLKVDRDFQQKLENILQFNLLVFSELCALSKHICSQQKSIVCRYDFLFCLYNMSLNKSRASLIILVESLNEVNTSKNVHQMAVN